jgi:hypothetical protein
MKAEICLPWHTKLYFKTGIFNAFSLHMCGDVGGGGLTTKGDEIEAHVDLLLYPKLSYLHL